MMIFVEIIAVIFSLVCVVLTGQRNVLAWPFGIVGVISYGFLFYSNELYSNAFLQIIFLGQSIMGWISWKLSANSDGEVIVTSMSFNEKMRNIKLFLVLFLLVNICLTMFTNYDGMQILDSLTAVGSLFAMTFIIKKQIEGWYVWITVDVIMVVFLALEGLYFSSVLYGIFFFLAINGYRKWKKSIENSVIV